MINPEFQALLFFFYLYNSTGAKNITGDVKSLKSLEKRGLQIADGMGSFGVMYQ